MQADLTSPYSRYVNGLYCKGESMMIRRFIPGVITTQAFLFVLAFFFLALPLAAQQLIANFPLGIGTYQLAVNSVSGKAYISTDYEDRVTVVDRDLSTTLIGAAGASYLAIDEVSNIIYVASYSSLKVIDGATNTVIANVNAFADGPMVVNPVTHNLYVISPSGVTVVNGTDYSTTSIPTGQNPEALAVNSVTNKIYVANAYSDSVTVIDGATNSTVTVPVQYFPDKIVLNPYTNKIYVASDQFEEWTVIDGATLSTTTLTVGGAASLDINIRTNKIYSTGYTNSMTVIDGGSLSITNVPLGSLEAHQVAVEPVTNKIYFTYNNYPVAGVGVMDGVTNRASSIFAATAPALIAVDSGGDRIYATDNYAQVVDVVAGPNALRFVPVTPCRVVDTRNPDGPFGGPTIQGGNYRIFPIPQGACNIPATAQAYSFNVTVVPQGHLGYLTLWPDGQGLPGVSTINSVDGRIKAGASISPAGAAGAVDAYASNTTDLILDINGYFERASSTGLAFYPLTGCRVADTRTPDGPLGGPYLLGDQERDFPVRESACGIPSTAQAYSLNVTAYPHGRLGYLTAWPQGQPQPQASTLNAINGLATANEAIVPAGVSGNVAVYPSADTDLTLDVNGYFAAPGEGGMSFYPLVPCRVLDTRQHHGAFTGTIVTDVVDSGCGTQDALVYVMNATVVPQTGLNHVTIWPTTQRQPAVYTLEAWDGVITSNLAIVANIDGWLNAYASNSTQLILDSFGYFAP
jgi:YVTN family beta-propeller protein